MMSASVVDINSKLSVLRMRTSKIKEVESISEKRVSFSEAPQRPSGCFPSLLTCFRKKVPASDSSSASTSTSKLKLSLFGISKQQKADASAIETAIEKVQSRLSDLEQRARTHRTLALRDKQDGRTPDALRELKKAKSVEKQVETTRVALDALERQLDTLSDLGLQRELASALTSTSKSLKGKTKGLVELADGAVELSQELQDDAEDVTAAFEGLIPCAAIDDVDLLAELNEMTSSQGDAELQLSDIEEDLTVRRPVARRKQQSYSEVDTGPLSFPSAPTKEIIKRGKGGERAGLISAH